jgi:hypothetical protein
VPVIGLFDVDDVKRLSDEQLTHLCNHMIRHDLRLAGIPLTHVDLNYRQYHADGGIDGWAQWDGNYQAPERIPYPLCGFQYKSGDFKPKAAGNEVQQDDRTDLKPQVRRLLEAGGAYILVLGREDPNTQEKEAYRASILDAIERHLGSRDYQILVYGASDVQSWAEGDVAAIAYVAACARHAHPAALRTIEELASRTKYINEYVVLASTEATAQAMLETLSVPGRVFRLDGLPGLGKTRLALEVAKDLEEAGIGTSYIDASGATPQSIVAFANDCARRGTTGVLIVDNCDLALHAQLEEEVARSQISLLSIDYNQRQIATSTPRKVLVRITDDELADVVSATFPELGQRPQDLRRIVVVCDGWPSLALLLAKGVLENRDDIAHLLDDQLMSRMLGITHQDHDSRRVIQSLSLFEHVGFDNDVAMHLTYVHDVLCGNIDRMRFDEIVDTFRQRGILVVIGRLLRLTPPPLAIRLATEWLRAHRGDAKRLLLDSVMPVGLAEFLVRQFEHLKTVHEAREIAAELLEREGPFDDAEVLDSRRGARIFRSLAMVNPGAAVIVLRHVLGEKSRDELLALRDGRRDLVWALERLLFPRETFATAALTLAQLAAAENEMGISNNASGVLRSLFLFGAQTEANGEARLGVLDALIAQNDPDILAVAADSVSAAINPHYVTAGYVVEPPSVSRDIRLWVPVTAQERDDYFSGLITRAKTLADGGGLPAESIRKAAARAVRGFVGAGRLDELADLLDHVSPGAPVPWKDALGELRDALHYELENAAADDLERIRVEELIGRLEPQTLQDRVALTITDPPTELRRTEKGVEDVAESRVREFARQVWKPDVLDRVLPLVVVGNQQRSITFGEALAQEAPAPRVAVERILEYTRVAPADHRNLGALAGALGVLANHDRQEYRELVRRLAQDPELRSRLPVLIALAHPDDHDAATLVELLNAGALPPDAMETLAYGRSLANVSEDRITRILDVLLDLQSYQTVFNIANMQTVGSGESWTRFAPYMERALSGLHIVTNPIVGFHDWSAIETVKKLLSEPGHDDFAITLASELFARSAEQRVSFEERSRMSEFAAALFEMYRDVAWEAFTAIFDHTGPRQRYWLLNALEYRPAGSVDRRLVFDDLDLAFVRAACHRYSNELAAFIAQYGEIYISTPNSNGPATLQEDQFEPSPLLSMLLEDFGDREDVRAAVVANLYSFISVGPRSEYYERRRRMVRRLPTFERAYLRDWVGEVEASLAETAREQRKRDDEFQGGAWYVGNA